MIAAPALRISNLRVDYGDFTAVDRLSLELPPGEIFGLAGPNGAGKTSTIRVLATLLDPTYGEIEVFGHDLFATQEPVHQLLGYMPDLAPVVPDLRVWEFLDLYAASHGLRGAQRRARVDHCLELVNLADKRNVYGRGLSRGMTQRVVLAKTLLHEPRLLLLDEPASGMDPIARRDMRIVLERLAGDGATVIVSSHILSELSDMCTSVGIMHLGRLLRSGPLRTVLRDIEHQQTQIDLNVIGDAGPAIAVLESRPEVSSILSDDGHLSVVVDGSESVHALLLKELVTEGIELSAFTPRSTGIESVLMDVIRSVDEP